MDIVKKRSEASIVKKRDVNAKVSFEILKRDSMASMLDKKRISSIKPVCTVTSSDIVNPVVLNDASTSEIVKKRQFGSKTASDIINKREVKLGEKTKLSSINKHKVKKAVMLSAVEVNALKLRDIRARPGDSNITRNLLSKPKVRKVGGFTIVKKTDVIKAVKSDSPKPSANKTERTTRDILKIACEALDFPENPDTEVKSKPKKAKPSKVTQMTNIPIASTSGYYKRNANDTSGPATPGQFVNSQKVTEFTVTSGNSANALNADDVNILNIAAGISEIDADAILPNNEIGKTEDVPTDIDLQGNLIVLKPTDLESTIDDQTLPILVF